MKITLLGGIESGQTFPVPPSVPPDDLISEPLYLDHGECREEYAFVGLVGFGEAWFRLVRTIYYPVGRGQGGMP